MKVYLGPYKDWWIGPWQLANATKYVGVSEDARERLGEWLSEKEWLVDACQWIYNHNPLAKRKIKVRIDRYDTWSMDHTLALLILPMLKQLNETKHGAPWVDDADVPEELKSTSAPAKENEWDTDGNHFKRWSWVLQEMIWTFEQALDEERESQFHTGNIDLQSVCINPDEPDKEKRLYEMVRGPNDTSHFDREGYKKYADRVQNGYKLFGKYYSNLWD